MYKALTEIGGYKKGDIVPDELAETWIKMYDTPPVEKVPGQAPAPKEEPKQDQEVMADDYLNRPAMVVVKNIKMDKLSKSTLKALMKEEKANKSRRIVLETIEERMGDSV